MAVRRGLFVRKDATAGTSPQDARLALAGLTTSSSGLGVVPGVLSGGFVTGMSAWTYSVGHGHFVTTRGAGEGAHLFSVDGATTTEAVSAAPASGSRYDLIWVRQRDVDLGDADSAAVVGVTSGSSSGSPSKPYGSVPAGALVLAEAQVFAGATQTDHASVTITHVATFVAARGGVIPARNASALDALVTAANPSGDRPVLVRLQSTGEMLEHAGAGWQHLPSAPGVLPSLEGTNSSAPVALTTVPGTTGDLLSPGLTLNLVAPARVFVFAEVHALPGGNAAGDLIVTRNGATVLTRPWHSRSTSQQQWPSLGRWITVPAGASTFNVRASLNVGSSGTSFDTPYLSVGAP